MSLKKKYLKKGICKVTFRLPKEVAPSASAVSLVGDFNDWDAEALEERWEQEDVGVPQMLNHLLAR